MLNFLFKREKNLEFELENQILKSMCIVNNAYLLIGKLDGNLLIYEFEKNCLVYEGNMPHSITIFHIILLHLTFIFFIK